jgi:anti-sigma factor RsiW
MNETHPSIEQIVDYLHGELPVAEDAAMHAHLTGCRSCDERRTEELALTERLRANARAQERDLPPSVVAKIRDAIEERCTSSLLERLRGGLRPIFILPAAAAIALIVFAGFGEWRAATAPTPIDAAYYVDEHAAMATVSPFGEEAAPATLASYDETR